MFRKSIWALIVFQILSAALHSLSFISSPIAGNYTEKQLLDLMLNYQMDMGGGIHQSMHHLMTGLSTNFTLICVFGAWINFYFLRNSLPAKQWKGLLLIEVIIFGLVFVSNVLFTFWPPIICTGLIFFASLLSLYYSINYKNSII